MFTPRLQQLQVARVAGQLLEQLGQFTGDPLILPIPADAPPEIPRIVLADPARTMRLQVGMSRSDLFVNSRPGAPLAVEVVFAQAGDILEVLLGALQIRPGRLAATGTFYHKCADPPRELAAQFCKPEWLNGPLAELRSFELHAHRRTELMEGLLVNSWVRCKSGSVSEGAMPSPAVVLERDVNTLQEEAEIREFRQDELKEFMRQAGSRLTLEIPEFFPR